MQYGNDGRITYELKYPFDLKAPDGTVRETIAYLALRRLKARDLRVLDKVEGAGSTTLALLGLSADLPPSTIDSLDAEDITCALEIVSDFLGGSLPTGKP